MSEQYLLDTCAWLDLKLAPQRVNEKTVGIARAQSILHLASISLMEVTRKSFGNRSERNPRSTSSTNSSN